MREETFQTGGDTFKITSLPNGKTVDFVGRAQKLLLRLVPEFQKGTPATAARVFSEGIEEIGGYKYLIDVFFPNVHVEVNGNFKALKPIADNFLSGRFDDTLVILIKSLEVNFGCLGKLKDKLQEAGLDLSKLLSQGT